MMKTVAEKLKRYCRECGKRKPIGELAVHELCRECAPRKVREMTRAREAVEQAFHQVEPETYAVHDTAKGIADSVIAMLEQGNLPPWQRGWASSISPHNAVTGHTYTGDNRWRLAAKAAARGWASPAWRTINQIHELGGTIRAGETSTVIRQGALPFKAVYVFNVEQVSGCGHGKWCRCSKCVPAPLTLSSGRVEQADAIVGKMPNRPRLIPAKALGEKPPHYSPGNDWIVIPPLEDFEQPERYYSTLFHELTHSTAHESRVGRDVSGYGENIHERAEEELVAEMGAAILCNHAGIGAEALENQAAYIEHWKERLRQPDGAWVIRKATAEAEKAAKYIIGEPDKGKPDGEKPAETAETRL